FASLRRFGAASLRSAVQGIGYAPGMGRRGVLVAVLLVALGLPLGAFAQEAPAGYPGQSSTVPVGMPTPTTAFERLAPGGPARDPGTLEWAQPGPYMAPNWTDFSLRSFSSLNYLATTY